MKSCHEILEKGLTQLVISFLLHDFCRFYSKSGTSKEDGDKRHKSLYLWKKGII